MGDDAATVESGEQKTVPPYVRGLRLSGSAQSLVLASRRGSIVVSPTNGEVTLGLKPQPPLPREQRVANGKPLHVQFTRSDNDGKDSLSRSSALPSSSSTSSESSLGGFSEARAPDGGWGWVVVAASFFVNLIADGITFSFGVIFVEFLRYFEEGKSKTAWIGSLFMAIPLLSGPIASFLTDRYGCRKCCVAGGLLAATGFVISAFSNSIELLFFTFGVLAGFGLSLCYVAAVVIVAYYFDARRSFATGLSVCGSGIGTFIFAPVTQALLSEYGWQGTTLILAGLFLKLCVCGMLMRDLEWTKAKRRDLREKKKKERLKKETKTAPASSVETYSATGSMQPHTPTSCPSVDELKRLLQKPNYTVEASESILIEHDTEAANRLCSSLVNLPTFVRNGEKVPLEVLEMLTAHKHLYHVLLHNYPSLLISSRSLSDSARLHEICQNGKTLEVYGGKERQLSAKFLQQTPETMVTSPCIEQWWIKPPPNTNRSLPTASYLKDLRVHRHSLTYRGAMLNINRYRLRASSCPDIYRNSMTTIAKEKVEWYSGLSDLCYLLADMLDLSFFTNIRFLCFAISNFLLYTWYDVPYVYLAHNAQERGYSETDASMLISVIGILNMIGEIVLGWAGDKEWVDPNMVYAGCMFLCGGVVALVPLVEDYESLCILSGAFGLFIAANYALTSIILVELITLERFTNAYGLLLLVQGVANLIGPPLAGWLYDITGEYTLSFYLAGAFIFLSGLLLLIHPCFESTTEEKVKKGSPSKLSNNI
ncbi:monocarboxylate transporter 5-like [Cimex lectularius]|uniref:Major facilitator superfamily (MFS) profile domain-containing protein n=1 Tax=Cimex lectularius TaxID=79782 RepID=A0A8I6SEA3_CIMLE|nr:monocarboxylate transporter 5-like [Cimex lectularius]XP_014259197.1 monocarboxylate transporter 5-like [Cimex lectularius]